MTMTDNETYNGWTNRETWAIQLHLSNNEGDYLAMREQAREILDDWRGTGGRDPVGSMSDVIKDWTEEVFDSVLNPEDGPPSEAARMFVADVGSWWRADFYEIATHWIDEAREESE